MDLRNDFLKTCEDARRGGFPLLDEVGDTIGRGFADVGSELFLVLPGEKLLSLFTGEKVNYQQADRAHYFSVPDVETVVREIEAGGHKVLCIERTEAREWRAEIRMTDGDVLELSDSELLLCLLKVFLK